MSEPTRIALDPERAEEIRIPGTLISIGGVAFSRNAMVGKDWPWHALIDGEPVRSFETREGAIGHLHERWSAKTIRGGL